MTTQQNTYETIETQAEGVVLNIREGVDPGDLFAAPDPIMAPAANAGPLPGLRSIGERHRYNQRRCAYKGGADQLFVTYEIEEHSSDDAGSYPQVTRVYLSGDLCGWEIGTFKTRSGAEVYGVKIEYQQTHETYRARDADTEYETAANSHRYTKIIEIPVNATSIELRSELPDRYRHALHTL